MDDELDWLGAAEAAGRLGVKPATLYAYVSRGQLRRRVGPDGRRSEYHPGDVADLAVRGRRARPVRASDIVLPTAVTAITPAGPRYRGHLATELAGRASFEAVAELLWDTGGPVASREAGRVGAGWRAPDALLAAARRVTAHLDRDDPTAIVLPVIAAVRGADPLRSDLRPASVATSARALLATLVAVAGDGPPRPGPIGEQVAVTLRAAATDRGAAIAGDAADATVAGRLVDAAMVLLADHELAASTVAARLAASARSDPQAVVLAAAAVHTGVRHGAASRPLEHALARVADGRDAATALGEVLTQRPELPGFGHPLYPHGDPRAVRLLQLLADSPLDERGEPLRQVLAVARDRGLEPPSIDVAVAGLTHAIGAPPGAGELIFALARIAGWIAHALEQYRDPQLLRPRAVFTGPAPDSDHRRAR